MYLIDTMYSIYKKKYRDSLLEISDNLANQTNRNQLSIALDMIYCSLKYGAMFTEYGDLDFIHRTKENRATFITTYYNFRLYEKLNNKDDREIFHKKTNFLRRFERYIRRSWIDLKTATDDDIQYFIEHHRQVAFKPDWGDSGKGVQIVDLDETITVSEVRKMAEIIGCDLIEERIGNCFELSELNSTSLNTIRCVTLLNEDTVHLLFAGLRVGAPNSTLDNISQGGSVANIDLQTGSICSPFIQKQSAHGSIFEVGRGKSIGFKIPFWNETIDLVKAAAKEIPSIRFVAWDVAITESGPEIIEGNESFGSVIMQLFYGSNEDGLKPILEKYLVN